MIDLRAQASIARSALSTAMRAPWLVTRIRFAFADYGVEEKGALDPVRRRYVGRLCRYRLSRALCARRPSRDGIVDLVIGLERG